MSLTGPIHLALRTTFLERETGLATLVRFTPLIVSLALYTS
jgi:hypothetical protein